MFLPTSTNLSLVSIIIFRGDNNLPVMFAGQAEVHLPHSVQVYESNNCFQVKSTTSFAPKRIGAPSLGGTAAAGSNINFTSLVTDSRLLNFPFAKRFEK